MELSASYTEEQKRTIIRKYAEFVTRSRQTGAMSWGEKGSQENKERAAWGTYVRQLRKYGQQKAQQRLLEKFGEEKARELISKWESHA